VATLAEREPRSVLPPDRRVDGVAPEKHPELASRSAHRMCEPDDRVVLLLDRRPKGALHDLKDLLRHSELYFVGITRTLSEASVKASRSAGLPRRSPGMHSPAPRSSTQRPHCTQSTVAPVRCACVRIAVTHSFVVGWSSASRSCPWTLFSCGVCFAKPRYTAPSYAKTLTFHPRLTARSIRRSAVVVRAFSKGGSMITKVSVRLSAMGSVPESLPALAEEVEHVVERRALDPAREP